MELRRLGHSGLWVSPLCLGTMMFGGRSDEKTATRIIGAARDAGVNFIDTADVYNDGRSESIVGAAIGRRRDDWVLATKAGNPMGEGGNRRGSGLKWLLQALDDSLRRLASDYVDIFYLHRDDPGTPLEETLGAVARILAAGKARYFGLSNFRGWRVAEAVHLCARMGVPRPVVCQPYYHALYRSAEVEVLPACAHHGLGVVAYSPLARGVLTGKYAPGQAPPADSRAGGGDPRILETEYHPEVLALAQKIKEHATERGMTAGDFALNWVLANPLVSAVLAGPRTEAQWESYCRALDHRLGPEDENFLDSLIRPGQTARPGYTDPQYPVCGRPLSG